MSSTASPRSGPWKFDAFGAILSGDRVPAAFSGLSDTRRMPMPTYEFLCPKCQKEFTVTMTIRERGEKKPACPTCGSTELESLFSSVVTKTSRKS
jgi:putative FmdB family regulatory protein